LRKIGIPRKLIETIIFLKLNDINTFERIGGVMKKWERNGKSKFF